MLELPDWETLMACFKKTARVSSLHKLNLSTLVSKLQTNQEVLRADMPTNPIEYPSSDYWNDSWSDDYLLERCQSAPQLQEAVFIVPGIDAPLSSIFVLCKDTVVKRLPNFRPLLPEVNALEFVRSRTSIPVPKVRRYITDKNGVEGYLMMEKIEGTPLNRLWDNLPGDARHRIVSTLRDYICQLREASGTYNCPFPGPIAENKPQTCVGPWMLFGDIPTGPFPTCKDLMQFVNKNSHQPLDDSQPLVLTHMDLTMRNIVVGTDWKVWLVDWEWSGFYPPWFEYIAMISATVNDNGPASWREYIPEVAGDWSKEKIMLGFWRF